MDSLRRLCISILLLALLTATGCANQIPPTASLLSNTPLPPQATLEALPPADASPTPGGPLKLRLWLPPQFNPASDSAAGRLLQYRLDEFHRRNSNILIETRIKAVSGPGGLLDSLTAASAAAPQALPDLVALPRDLLETAALKGLLLPLDNLTDALDDPDWYNYASDLARLQKNIYGLPFAGDALVQVYHPGEIAHPPADFQSVLDVGQPLVFPAAGEQPYLTLALYAGSGGGFTDDQSRPFLSPLELTQVLTFYLSAKQAGVMPAELLSQIQSDQQAWEAFTSNQSGLAVTWTSRFLGNRSPDIALSPIPTRDGKPFTLAIGWVWALAGRDEQKRASTIKLAEFLTDSQFLASWTHAVGYLPTRPTALRQTADASLQETLQAIALSARLLPSTDILSSLENPLEQAVLAILKGQSDPLLAAQAAAASLTSP